MILKPFRTWTVAILALTGLAWGCKPDTSQPAPTSQAAAKSPLVILVAASARDAISEAATTFTAETGVAVSISGGSSNVLANQILAGAPASLFLSANLDWAKQVQDQGLAASQVPLLTNQLVLIVPKGNPAGVKSPADLTGSAVRKIALAGPNVPAGKYAEQALRAAKVYPQLLEQSKIARGQDVRLTAGFVEHGEAEAGVVYSTDVRALANVETVYTFDSKTYDPIVYPLVLLKSAEQDAARQFFDYLQSAKAEAIFARHGFNRLKP